MKTLTGFSAALAVSFLLVSGCDSCISKTGDLHITVGTDPLPDGKSCPSGPGWGFMVSGPGGFSKTLP